ncbi:DUF3320 domain-containing protein [Ornithinimicrobium sp. LYQ121]|uniref:DUF3320 domain-containing protein n=1 Tax=Ornithinimicrobium sp. LYQ121 TaxID=3378801 RepID=UPI0038551AEA
MEIDASPVISLAMVHNGVAPVRSIVLTNAGPALDEVEVRVVIRDADGTLSEPAELLLDLPSDGATRLADVALRMDATAMLEMQERRSGVTEVVVRHRGTELTTQRVDVVVLAGRQWLSQPAGLGLEMLAAHVMPNSPVVESLLSEASVLLRTATGSSSVEGYQSGPERVDQIAGAVFDAMRARNIRYANPPASWTDHGQKVRTPEEVLEGKVGTCLDTTVVYAAALEQAGLRPLLWVVKGHAFVGYWREEMVLDAIATTDASPMTNLLDLDLVRVVETTMLTEGHEEGFHAARSAAASVARVVDDVIGIVDVLAARRNGVVPLPSRRRLPSGEVQVVEYRAAQHSVPMPRLTGRTPTSSRTGDGPAVPPRVQQWKNSLLDLSLRNRLINFKPDSAVTLVVPEGHLGAVEDVLHDGRPVTLLASDAIDEVAKARGVRWARDLPQPQLFEALARRNAVHTDITAHSYATRLRSLAYKARTIEEETGANNLYLALGTLAWELENKKLHTPLILVPVKLVATGRGERTSYRLRLDESGGSTPNYCLLEKLKQTHGLEIPELAEPKEDLSGIDLAATLTSVRQSLAEKGLPFHVEETAHLAILQFAKFRLWKDLDENWPTLLENPLARHLADTPTEHFVDPAREGDAPVDLDELAAVCPIPADASQLTAIAEALAGSTFVLEGPPGTGKSQTITNLLARALADGKRVLFVAEKRAALDVVKKRMDAVGLGPFSLDLHDKGSKPAAVRAQIKQALEHRTVVDREGLGVASEELASATRTLARYRKNLHEENGAGLSLYSAHTRRLALDGARPLPVPEHLLERDGGTWVSTTRSLLVSLPEVAVPARPRMHHAWGMVRVDRVPDAAWEEVVAATQAVWASLRLLQHDGRLGAALRTARSREELDVLARLAGSQVAPVHVLDETRTSSWQTATKGLQSEVRAFATAAHPGLEVATPGAMDLPLADIHGQARTAAASSWFGRKKRLRAVVDLLGPGLKPGAEVHPKEVVELTGALVQVQSAVRALAVQADGIAGLSVPEGWNPLTQEGQGVLASQVEWLEWTGRQVADASHGAQTGEPRNFASVLRDFVASGESVPETTTTELRRLAEALAQLSRVLEISEQAWTDWAGEAGLLQRWSDTESERRSSDASLSSLHRWLTLRGHLAPLRQAGMNDAHAMLLAGTVHADDAARAFDRGVAEASLRERQVASGLDVFDPAAHERTIARFARSGTQVRTLLPGQLQAQIVENRPFRSGTTAGKIGALQRELEKRRGGLAVRPLLQGYGDLITQLMPCVLVSPDSLARFFPVAGAMFDIVVFDEASQIRVADAIGAIGRAKSVVVVGDSKQMPPTSFAESSIVSEDHEEEVVGAAMVVEDQESILSEAVQARVDRHWLSWHYRSQDESLIAFSNQHYYLGKLSSFPAPTGGSASPHVEGYGISLVRVDGTFHRGGKGKLLRTNPVEAEAIVSDIRRRFDAHRGEGSPSVGVVTFNQQQRAHIEALIRDHEDPRLAASLDSTDEEGLFIKNLENVQGDERDVILFSTAFSVNAKGELPLNFGPLNREGGERRLNVAITRARRQVVIYSSFDPGQLRAGETSSLGISHLKAYLGLAANGTGALEDEVRRSSETDRHREDVAASLRMHGLAVQTDIGLSDFRVDLALSSQHRPERPLVAVVLDGPGWASRGTVGDRDGLPVQVLKGMLGWPEVARVWLPAWLEDRDSVEQDLLRLVKLAEESAQRALLSTTPSSARTFDGEAPPRETGGGAANPTKATDVDNVRPPSDAPTTLIAGAAPVLPMPAADIETDDRLEGEEAFVPCAPGWRGPRAVLDGLPSRTSQTRVEEVIKEILRKEGPIHEQRLAKLVAAAFELTRVNADRAASILRCAPAGSRSPLEKAVLRDTAARGDAWEGFRRDESGERDIAHVPLLEMANAMRALCRGTGGLDEAELLRETLRVFGYTRMTPRVVGRMTEGLQAAVTRGAISKGLDGQYQSTS